MSMMGDSEHGDGTMADINMTPLIDVMLVLLIIFIVTLPVINHAVKVSLPQASSTPAQVQPKDIDVSVTAAGEILWNRQPVDDAGLAQHIAEASAAADPAAINLFADEHVEYGRVAKLLSTLHNGGLNQIRFVTDPNGAAQ
jgi:biopolymer transport protein ExbD